jgi:hypothetical protein
MNHIDPSKTNGKADRTSAAPRVTLDDLARLRSDELEALYRNGTVPGSLAALDGEPHCRMLAIRKVPSGRVFDGIARFSASRIFPWGGKAFQSQSAAGGTGINRVRLEKERRWFPFETRVEPSAIDGAPCILLDYDKPENPLPIRRIRDELREVSPGLFLGPAMLDTKRGAPVLVLWFACDNGA